MPVVAAAGKAALELALSSPAGWSNRVACEQSPALPLLPLLPPLPPGLRCLSPSL